nr:Chain B, PTGSSSTNPFL PEPTIDE [synthetic construct]
PTGSSSTNPFL